MTRYTVLWDEDVEREFIEKWIAGDSIRRMTLTGAADWIDKNLAEDPESRGVFWPDEEFRIAHIPLALAEGRVSVSSKVDVGG